MPDKLVVTNALFLAIVAGKLDASPSEVPVAPITIDVPTTGPTGDVAATEPTKLTV